MNVKNNIFRKDLQRNDWLIIVSNMIPVAGVWFWGWSATEVFIVYAMETLIVGILTVLKLLIATLFKKKDSWQNGKAITQVSGFFFIIFFILHFGIFAAVQTSIFSGVTGIIPPGKGGLYFFFHWWEYINKDIAWMLGGFIISYLARDLFPFILNQDFKTTPMMLLMFQPYGRIFIQQFTVILGSMFLNFGLDKGFVLVFALIKIFFEVFFNYNKILDSAAAVIKEKSGKQ